MEQCGKFADNIMFSGEKVSTLIFKNASEEGR